MNGGVGHDEREHRRHLRMDHAGALGDAGDRHLVAGDGRSGGADLMVRVGRHDGARGGFEIAIRQGIDCARQRGQNLPVL